MTGMTPRDTREWMRTIERGLLQARGAASSAVTVAQDRLDQAITVVNNDRNRVPAPPIELTTQTYIALGPNKRFGAGVIVDFPDVTIGNDALPMTIQEYELWGRKGTENFVRLTTAEVSSLQWFGANPGDWWDFKVRAIGALAVKPGVFSSVVTVQMLNDTTAPGMPSTPTAQGQGRAITIKWDGKIAGGADMPLDLEYVVIAGGPDPSPTTEISRFTPGPGLFVDAMVPYNTPMFYRLQAVDTAGNRSAWSAQASAVGMPLVDDDIIMAQINAAETEIINIGAASILNGAINSAKLADNSVSQIKLQDQIVSLAKLDTSANNKIQQGIDDAFAAQTKANTADGRAGTALTNAATADGKAVGAQTAADAARKVADAQLAAGVTLNLNGNFDSDPITSPPLGWPTGQNAVVQASATTARSGTNVLKCTPSTGGTAYRYTDLVASAKDRIFYVEYWVRPDQAIIAANNGLLLGAYFTSTDVSGNAVASPQYSNGALYPQVPLSALTPGTWTKFAVTYKVTQTDNAQIRFGPRIPNLVTAGNTFEVDGFRAIDITESQAALDAAAAAQTQADLAFTNAGAANTAAGLAQTSANGKNNIMYMSALPGTTSWADGDTVFIRTAPGAPITAQWKWVKTGPTTGSWNQETLGHQILASVDLGKATVGELNGIYVKAFSLGADTLKIGSSTNLFPDSKMLDTAGWPTTAGVTLEGVGTGKNGQGSILIAGSATQVGLYYSNGDLAKRIPVQPNSSYRLNVWVRAGVTVPVGTVSFYARQYPLDGSAFSFTTPDRISNDAKSVGGDGTIAANTWTMMSGVVTTGPTDTSLVIGLYKQPGMTSAVRFSDPTIEVMGVGRLIVDGTIQGVHIQANSIAAKHMTITDLTNFAPSLAESPTDWTLNNSMQIITSGLDASGYRFSVVDAAAESRAYGPFMAVSPGENLWMGANLYRASGTTPAAYLRYYFYDKDKVLLAGGAGTQYVGAPQSSASASGVRFEGPALVPAGAAYTRLQFIVALGTGSTGFYNIVGRRRLAGELIIDGTVTSDKVATNGITAKQILVGDFANIAIGSDFEDASAVPWVLDPLHTLTTSQKKSGTTSLKLAAGPGVDSSVFVGDLRVKEGEQYYFKYHAYIDATFNGTTSNSKLRITDQAGGNVVSLSYASITRSAWTTNPLEVTYTVPAGVTSLKVYMNSDHTVGTAYVDDIQIRRVSEASLIMNLGVEKLTAGSALIDTGVITKLYTEVVRSRRMTTDMMVVGRGVNGIVDEFFDAADLKTYRDTACGGWGGWSSNGTINLNWYGGTLTAGTSRSFYYDTVGSYDKNSYIPVEPGQVWRLSAMYTSTVSGPRAAVKVIKRDGTNSYTVTGILKKDGTTNSYAAAGSQQTLERMYTVPSDVAYMMPALQFESTCTSAYVYGGATMTNMASAALIVEGAISTRHLTVTEDMTVKLLAAHKIIATEIDTNNLGADVGFIGVMTGNILTVDSINGTMISATGGITSKHTITGATIQTLTTANRGIKISGGNLSVYDSTGTGNKTFSITGSSGAVSGTGVWKTGSAGNYIEMTADAGGGLLRFWTGSGTGRGNIYARDDAGGKRMTITYSDLDAPAYTVPLIAVWDDKVNLSYGSKVIQVGKNASGGEEMLLDADGARVRVLGNFSLESGRLQTYYNWANTATIGGYVGQRPETAVTTNDFEVRAASGSVRLTGTDLYANPIYNNTTASSANVFVGSDGLVKRVSSASRYKVDQQVMVLSDTLLDIPVKDWLDKAAWDEKAQLEALPVLEGLDLERYNALVLDRFPGVIAEEVEQAEGGEQFVVYGQDGQTESVMYDRLAVAQIAVLYRRLLEAERKITELQNA